MTQECMDEANSNWDRSNDIAFTDKYVRKIF